MDEKNPSMAIGAEGADDLWIVVPLGRLGRQSCSGIPSTRRSII
jgi:hypothetical protein